MGPGTPAAAPPRPPSSRAPRPAAAVGAARARGARALRRWRMGEAPDAASCVACWLPLRALHSASARARRDRGPCSAVFTRVHRLAIQQQYRARVMARRRRRLAGLAARVLRVSRAATRRVARAIDRAVLYYGTNRYAARGRGRGTTRRGIAIGTQLGPLAPRCGAPRRGRETGRGAAATDADGPAEGRVRLCTRGGLRAAGQGDDGRDVDADRRRTSPARSSASQREDGLAHPSWPDVVLRKRVAAIGEFLVRHYGRDALVPLQYIMIHRSAARRWETVVTSSAP